MEIKMSVADARKKLGEMQTELERIPANCHVRADREYRVYLQINIDSFEKQILAFENGQQEAK